MFNPEVITCSATLFSIIVNVFKVYYFLNVLIICNVLIFQLILHLFIMN